jgi:zinc D-Ala-D-Ala carboxypeptidase
MQLTENFTLEELTTSQVAIRNRLYNIPDLAIVQNLLHVAVMLEQVRTLVGKPIHINSGYRSAEVNKAVGGSAKSDHVKGLAADITVPGLTAKALALLIRESDIPFDQLVYEGTWVHISVSLDKPRRQTLTAHFSPSGTTYTAGIS